MYPPCIVFHAKHLQRPTNKPTKTQSHDTGEHEFSLPAFNHEDVSMFRRITLLIPALILLSLSGCIIMPRDHGGWHDHRYYGGGPGYYGGGPGYYHR